MSLGRSRASWGSVCGNCSASCTKGWTAVAALLWQEHGGHAVAAAETQELENELNRWEIARTRCELPDLVNDTAWTIQPLLDERGVTLQLDVPSAPVLVDATLTRQALFKILRLVVRSLPRGTVHVTGRDHQDHTDLVISAPRRPWIARNADWQAAQLLLRAAGECCSLRPPQVVVGWKSSHAAAGGTAPCPHHRRQRAAHQLFERYLAPQHYEVIHAHNGKQALQLIEEKQPDAITLDVMMPNVDGWQVLRMLAGKPATARIPVIICSVLQEPDLAFSLGARAYLKKPVDRQELIATLARLLAPADRAAAAPPPTPPDS